jgi:hypothetical protein
MSWIDDLADHVETALPTISDLYFETFDLAAPDCVIMVSSPGTGASHKAGIKTLHKGEVGFRVRNRDQETAKNQAELISAYFELKTSFWAGSTWFKRVTNDNGFYHVSTDQVNGSIYSVNCYIEYEE